MEKIDIINNFCKVFIINLYTYMILTKIIDFKRNSLKKFLYIVIISIFLSMIYVLGLQYVNPVIIMPTVYCIYGLVLSLILKEKFSYCFLLANISFVFTYIIYWVSLLISVTILRLGFGSSGLDYKNTIIIGVVFVGMLIIYFLLTNLRRFKNGINFLKNSKSVDKKGIIINIFSLISYIILGMLNQFENNFLTYTVAWITIILGGIIIYWIQSQIKKYYKKNMRDRTIEIQKLDINEQQKIIENLKEENLQLANVVHRYNNRLSAVEMALNDIINKNSNIEFSKEISILLDDVKQLSKNFAKESNITKNVLPATNISGIDNMFKYFQNEAINNNINFDFKINNSINDLINNTISKDKFETLLGDHLRDAIIAINNSRNSYKSILVTLGLVENNYELSIYDTGIEFEIDTLLKLGKEKITTHKESGGTGTGFITTFGTLEETNASLEIEEYNPETSSYTKSVNIVFDGKREYRIYSYRAEEIKIINNDKKIIIKRI